jgi:glycosyltransferase involved in cell wall biosynthesis
MTKSSNQKTTAIIPAYNEEKTIESVVGGALKHVAEVPVIDDRSEDGTRGQTMNAGAMNTWIHRNQSNGNALSIRLTAVTLNGSDEFVALDSDCRHDSENRETDDKRKGGHGDWVEVQGCAFEGADTRIPANGSWRADVCDHSGESSEYHQLPQMGYGNYWLTE